MWLPLSENKTNEIDYFSLKNRNECILQNSLSISSFQTKHKFKKKHHSHIKMVKMLNFMFVILPQYKKHVSPDTVSKEN